jgi:hypothetical protein
MSDDRPTPNGNGDRDSNPARPVRCTKCAKIMTLGDTFPELKTGHKMHVAEGGEGPCGPVALEFLFHVTLFLFVNGNMNVLRRLLPSIETPEENYRAVLDMWETAVAATFKAMGQNGAPIIGLAPPRPVVTDWKPITARLA